jgi:hypothetical protein
MNKSIAYLLIFAILATSVFAGIDENGTITCPEGEDDIQGICHLIQGPSAGLGLFIEYITSPTGTLVLMLVIVSVLAAIGFAIAFAIKRATGVN